MARKLAAKKAMLLGGHYMYVLVNISYIIYLGNVFLCPLQVGAALLAAFPRYCDSSAIFLHQVALSQGVAGLLIQHVTSVLDHVL